MPDAGILAEAVRIGRSLTAATAAEPEILSTRRDVLVVRVGDVVVKVHPGRTDPAALAARLQVAADPRLADVLVPPIEPCPRTVEGRQVTVWPAGLTVSPDAQDAPWEAGAELLARLHAFPAAGFGGPLPPCTAPVRLNRAVRRLGDDPFGKVIRQAYATLPSWVRMDQEQEREQEQGEEPEREQEQREQTTEPVLVHGDWHLGQLVRTPGAGWRLIDVDDLGWGHPDPGIEAWLARLLTTSPGTLPDTARPGCGPEWDLARPAALYAAGVLHPEVWDRFLAAYRRAGGCAVPADLDPWRILDTPAKTLTIQIAATCVIVAQGENRPLNESETELVETCRRIAGARPA